MLVMTTGFANNAVANAVRAFPKVVEEYLRLNNLTRVRSEDDIFEVLVTKDLKGCYQAIVACKYDAEGRFLAGGMGVAQSMHDALTRLLDAVATILYTQVSSRPDEEDEMIRCICGDDNPKDKRAFIGCESCCAWQHNVCMGIAENDVEVPERYYCERCRPEEHVGTVQAMKRGEKIWETRNKIFEDGKKAGKKATSSRG